MALIIIRKAQFSEALRFDVTVGNSTVTIHHSADMAALWQGYGDTPFRLQHEDMSKASHECESKHRLFLLLPEPTSKITLIVEEEIILLEDL